MASSDPGPINQSLQVFLNQFQAGTKELIPWAYSLFGTLLVIEIVFFGIWASMGSGEGSKLLKRVLTWSFIFWVITDYQDLVESIKNGFIDIGKKAATVSNNENPMDDPSAILHIGLQTIKPLLTRMNGYGMLDVGQVFVEGIPLLVTYAAFLTLTIQVFITRVEFGLLAMFAFILLPFGALKQTSFLAEKTFSLFVSFGVKFMTLTFLVSVGGPLMQAIALPGEGAEVGDFFSVAAVSATFTVLCLHAPGLAAGLLSGAPSLGGVAQGLATSALSTGASAVGGAASAGLSAAKAGAGAALSAVTGGGGGGGGASNSIGRAVSAMTQKLSAGSGGGGGGGGSSKTSGSGSSQSASSAGKGGSSSTGGTSSGSGAGKGSSGSSSAAGKSMGNSTAAGKAAGSGSAPQGFGGGGSDGGSSSQSESGGGGGGDSGAGGSEGASEGGSSSGESEGAQGSEGSSDSGGQASQGDNSSGSGGNAASNSGDTKGASGKGGASSENGKLSKGKSDSFSKKVGKAALKAVKKADGAGGELAKKFLEQTKESARKAAEKEAAPLGVIHVPFRAGNED